MTLAFIDPDSAAEPRTHALVIGVGAYDYLPGGPKEHERKLGSKTFGMGKLMSPPESARAFARWLLGPARCQGIPANWGLNNPNAPLGSVELLVTDPSPVVVNGTAYIPLMPCVSEVERAFDAWVNRANYFETNVALFYFCGHGVELKQEHRLLLSDFGKSRNPWDDTLLFTSTHSGMASCRAGTQCYFIDTCREDSPDLRNEDPKGGKALTKVDLLDKIKRRVWTAPVYYATSGGQRAYGNAVGGVSDFTLVLLEALTEAAAVKRNNRWEVDTDSLLVTVRRLAKQNRLNAIPQPGMDAGQPTVIHCLSHTPSVPARITCLPPHLIDTASVYLKRGQQVYGSGHKVNRTWQTRVPAGVYSVGADFPCDPTLGECLIHEEVVMPPGYDRELEVD